VAGVSFTDSAINAATGLPTTHPFLWENGEMTDLGTLGGDFGEPEGLNNRGQVVGGMNLSGDVTGHAFLWEQGSLTDLGTLGGSFGLALAVNDSGAIVGAASNQDEATLAFVWKKGVMTGLGALKGDDCSIAKAINSRGQIVGTSFSCAVGLPSENAALWENSTVVDLNSFVPLNSDLHLTGDDMYINERGEIAGIGIRPNGDKRAFLLIPCGEGTEGCQDAAEGGFAATQNNPAPVTKSPTTSTQGRPTPSDMTAGWRARLARRYHIPGLTRPRD
jgi:probable HAF family extracellular repeat protein